MCNATMEVDKLTRRAVMFDKLDTSTTASNIMRDISNAESLDSNITELQKLSNTLDKLNNPSFYSSIGSGLGRQVSNSYILGLLKIGLYTELNDFYNEYKSNPIQYLSKLNEVSITRGI